MPVHPKQPSRPVGNVLSTEPAARKVLEQIDATRAAGSASLDVNSTDPSIRQGDVTGTSPAGVQVSASRARKQLEILRAKQKARLSQ